MIYANEPAQIKRLHFDCFCNNEPPPLQGVKRHFARTIRRRTLALQRSDPVPRSTRSPALHSGHSIPTYLIFNVHSATTANITHKI